MVAGAPTTFHFTPSPMPLLGRELVSVGVCAPPDRNFDTLLHLQYTFYVYDYLYECVDESLTQYTFYVYILRIRFTSIFYLQMRPTSSPFLFRRRLPATYLPSIYLFTALYTYTFSALIYVYVYRSYKRITAAHPFYVYVYCTDKRYICIRLLLKVFVEVVARFSAAALCALRESQRRFLKAKPSLLYIIRIRNMYKYMYKFFYFDFKQFFVKEATKFADTKFLEFQKILQNI